MSKEKNPLSEWKSPGKKWKLTVISKLVHDLAFFLRFCQDQQNKKGEEMMWKLKVQVFQAFWLQSGVKDSWDIQFSSVQFSRSVVSNSLWPHELQHTRPLCPSPTPGAHPNSCPSSQWCHPTISSSVVPFFSRPQSFPASGSFQWVGASYQVAKVLEFHLPHQSFQWIFRTDFL